eukprot:m.855977 g.855977  ORF g.855977 m.855977 type:complete len:478 (-) comp23510_c0_seq39:59-1492(-)
MHAVTPCGKNIRVSELVCPCSSNRVRQDIHNSNETLYHKLLVEHMEHMAPLVYTPTVGEVCKQFGAQYTRCRGMYFSQDDKGHFSHMVYNWPHDDVHVIVVTDGSRILGLGDLGVYGMGIPIGKLALYCAAGGIAPHRVLPVVLDVGCNNAELRDSPDYIGLQKERATGAEYYSVVDEFMHAVFHRWPNVVVQFEDFESSKAVPLLSRYRHRYRTFNDDIQGTGCVTLAGLLAAARNTGTSIKDIRVLCAGAGSSGLGVCEQIVRGMMAEGLSEAQARSQFVVVSSLGAIGRPDNVYGNPNHARGLSEERTLWQNDDVSDGAPMEDIMDVYKPNCLLGLSTQGGIFTKEVITEMAKTCDRPIIMPMSNPVEHAECTPEQAYEWTNGRAVVATGSPFAPVERDGQTLYPSQCNNMYAFPGIGCVLRTCIDGHNRTIHIMDALVDMHERNCWSIQLVKNCNGNEFTLSYECRCVELKAL